MAHARDLTNLLQPAQIAENELSQLEAVSWLFNEYLGQRFTHAQEVIFEKFSRLEKGGSGIGLGLFISRELMSSMGGHLWAGEASNGAALRCRVPAA